MDVARGARLGPYVVDAPLGAGGMGEVWRALDPRIGRTVAIKVLPHELRADEDRLRRFEQEARAVGALSHPNLLVLFDVGHHDGMPYLVTELLEGESLRTRLAGGPLAIRTALRIAADVARGLAAAHGAGIVHRDVKPDNLFITVDGRVKILDFGVAKLRRAPGELDDDPGARTATASPETMIGAVLGTPAYMAPEQIAGRPLDARADLFSLGVVLHEMLAGKRPFLADTAVEEQASILRAAPAPLDGVPAAIETIVLRCLEKRPEARFQSASDLAFALDALADVDTPRGERALAAGTSPVPPSSSLADERAPHAARRAPIAVIALAAAALGAIAASLAAWALASHAPARTIAAPTTPAPAWPAQPGGGAIWRRVTFGTGIAWPAHFAPDGRSVIYSTSISGAGNYHVVRSDLEVPSRQDLGIPGRLVGVSSAGELAIARQLLPYTPAVLERVFPGAGGPRAVADHVVDATFGPTDQLLAIRRIEGTTTLEYPIGTVVTRRTEGALATPRVAPDDHHIAVIEKLTTIETRGRVVILDRNGVAVAASPYHDGVVGEAWCADGREVWFSTWTGDPADNGLFALDLAGHERLLLRGGGIFTIQDVARDGRLLMQRLDNRIRMFAIARGGGAARDAGWLDGSSALAISADGQTMLFAETMGTGETKDGYAVYARKGDAPPILVDHAYTSTLVPDGSAVISITGLLAPMVRVPTGAGATQTLPRGEIARFDINDALALSWDGRWLVVRGATIGAPMRLWRQDLRGGDPVAFGPRSVDAARHPISPDGAWVAIAEPAGGVRLLSPTGAPDRALAGAVFDEPIAWSGDGASIYVLAGGAFPRTLFKLDVATGKRTPWLSLTAPDTAETGEMWLAIDAAGDRAFYSVFTPQSDLYVVERPR